MDKRDLLLRRLEQIAGSVSKSGNTLGLLALGSCGKHRERLDEYSDLDFFVIVKEGYKQQYLEKLDWLTGIAEAGYFFRNTPDGYKFLFKDGIFCEFAVFDPEELKRIPADDGLYVWKDESLILSEKPPWQAGIQEQPVKETQWLIGEALTNLYVGLERFRRGEKLSACRFVQSYAVDRILDLSAIPKAEQAADEDIFDKSRRIEVRVPELAKVLPDFIQGYERTPESAKAILEYLEANYEVDRVMAEFIRDLL